MLWQTFAPPQRLTPCDYEVMPKSGRPVDLAANESIHSRGWWRR
jgi:hypothetical protein